MRRIRITALVLALVSLAVLSGCAATPASTATGGPAPAEVTVSLKGGTITPAAVTVAVGGTVVFNNDDSVEHTIAGDAFSTGPMAPGAQFFQVFKTAGTFPIRCTIHPSMTGSITVK